MSRSDNIGMWWHDIEVPKLHSSQHMFRNVEPPATGWKPPTEFPNLSGAKLIGLDTETKDLELTTRGPGAVRGAAHAIGVSVAVGEKAWYFPIRHEYSPQSAMNMDPAKVFEWLSALLSSGVAVCGANLMYDLEVLRAEGVSMPTGPLYDVQFAEPLIDEEARSYALEVLARKYLGEGKDTPLLYQWCSESFGGKPVAREQAQHFWRSPPTLVGPYAEADAILPLKILRRQSEVLKNEDLVDLFKLECGLIPLLLDMRFRGVPVDLDKAQKTATWLRAEAAKAQARLPGIDVWANESLARAFDKAGIEYPRTEAGNPSFTRLWMETQEHDLAKAVLSVRQYEKAANPFVEAYILGAHHEGRLHCQFNPLRSDDYGTVSGRFSSSNPNLQNIPARDKVLGPMLRSLFIPEPGCRWRRADYSQIEYRLLAHYAIGEHGKELRRLYSTNPKTDFHAMTRGMILDVTELDIGRGAAKNINFGLVYGMGRDKTTRSLGVSPELGERLVTAYHTAMPSVKATYDEIQRRVQRRGYVKTLLGRRRRFDTMEENKFRGGQQRAGVHKSLNALLQGGAADIMKKAMYECFKAGLFAPGLCGTPHLTVHDELDWSDEGTPRSAEAFKEVERIMTTCVDVRVPLMLDMVVGANWGECK